LPNGEKSGKNTSFLVRYFDKKTALPVEPEERFFQPQLKALAVAAAYVKTSTATCQPTQ
jgi:hypothetical protein